MPYEQLKNPCNTKDANLQLSVIYRYKYHMDTIMIADNKRK